MAGTAVQKFGGLALAPSASATFLASACGFGQNRSVLSFP
jgi:hypothetical protein